MKVYFLAEQPCALTVNGIFLGMIDGFERFARISPEDGVFVEIKPERAFPVNFCFNEEFLFAPPPQIRLYFTENAVAVYATDFIRQDQSLHVLKEEVLDGARLTLYRQGGLFLRFEKGVHKILPLSDALERCMFRHIADGYLLEGEAAFLLLNERGETLLASEGKVLKAGDTLEAEIPFHDSLFHSARCEWKGGKLIHSSILKRGEPTQATFALALFESVLIGADCTPFLHEKIRHKADSLKEFLGDYVSVVLTDRPDKIGLVYRRTERVFDVRYYRVEVEDEQISNIVPL